MDLDEFQNGDVVALRGEPEANRAVVINVLPLDGALVLRGFAGDLPHPSPLGIFLDWTTPMFRSPAADFELVSHRPDGGWLDG